MLTLHLYVALERLKVNMQSSNISSSKSKNIANRREVLIKRAMDSWAACTVHCVYLTYKLLQMAHAYAFMCPNMGHKPLVLHVPLPMAPCKSRRPKRAQACKAVCFHHVAPRMRYMQGQYHVTWVFLLTKEGTIVGYMFSR